MKKKIPSLSLRTLEESLFPIWSSMTRTIRHCIATWKIPSPAAFALLHLHTHPEDAEPALLSEVICVPRQTMTFTLDVLEKLGLANREPHPDDRRKKVIMISKKGRALAEKIIQDLLTFEVTALADFSTNDLVALRTLSKKFAEALQKVEKHSLSQRHGGTEK